MTELPAAQVGDLPKVCKSRWSRVIERIAQADTPHRTATAFAFGVFLSFSPFIGLQILIGVAIAFLARLSRVAVIAGLCANLPWIMVPWYTVTTAVAATALGTPIGTDVRGSLARLLDLSVWGSAFWSHAAEIVAPFLWSFLIGSTIGALIVGLVAYLTVVRVVTRMQSLPATAGELVID